MTQQFHTWVFTWEKENIYPLKDLDQMFIAAKLETTQMSINKRINK